VGPRTSQNQETAPRSPCPERTDHPPARSSPPGRRQEPTAIEPILCDLISVLLRHFFPDWNQWLDSLPDPRRPEYCTYSIRHLITLALSLFLFQSGSRRQLRGDRRTPAFLANLLELTGTHEATVADPDTMNYLLERMPPEGLETLVVNATRTLIRSKVFDQFRFDGSVLVAVDATELFRCQQPHCPTCLKTKHSDTSTTYSHSVLEAKLVGENGMAVSLTSVFMENADHGFYDKQDCELKAFYRLAPKLKSLFPRLRIVLLLDALYANQHVIDFCEQYGWEYLIVFKDGSLPTLYAEALRECQRRPYNRHQNQTQSFAWAHNLTYQGHTLHAIFAHDRLNSNNGRFAFITNIRPHSRNIENLINHGGRRRWVIENQGFNSQKTGGYELEHGYGRQGYAWKNYYFLLQLAHLLNQLMVKTDLFGKVQRHALLQTTAKARGAWLKFIVATAAAFYGSIHNFIKRLGESFRYHLFTELGRSMEFPRSIQIRFAPIDTS
jgi:hypothetical protein